MGHEGGMEDGLDGDGMDEDGEVNESGDSKKPKQASVGRTVKE